MPSLTTNIKIKMFKLLLTDWKLTIATTYLFKVYI